MRNFRGKKVANSDAALGHDVYKKIKNVIKLTDIKRQDHTEFISFLNRFRDGRSSEADCRLLNETCLTDGIPQREQRC